MILSRVYQLDWFVTAPEVQQKFFVFYIAALVSFLNTCHECLKGVVGPKPVELALL